MCVALVGDCQCATKNLPPRKYLYVNDKFGKGGDGRPLLIQSVFESTDDKMTESRIKKPPETVASFLLSGKANDYFLATTNMMIAIAIPITQ